MAAVLNPSVLTPKGSDSIAQGIALGKRALRMMHPEGVRQALSQPFRLDDK